MIGLYKGECTIGLEVVMATFLVYNVHLFGQSLPSVVQWIARLQYQDRLRMEAIIDALIDEEADVVGLVEVWDDGMAQEIVQGVASAYPYHWRPTGPSHGNRMCIGTGLLLLSRWPLTNQVFTPFVGHGREERLAEKGVACAQVEIRDDCRVAVLLAHTKSGVFPPDRRTRANDMAIISDVSSACGLECAIRVIMGDFNTKSDEEEIFGILHAQDCWRLPHKSDPDPGFTFDSVENQTLLYFYPYLRLRRHQHRYDRILYIGGEGVKVIGVEVPRDQYVFSADEPCSDHFPVRVQLMIEGNNTI